MDGRTWAAAAIVYATAGRRGPDHGLAPNSVPGPREDGMAPLAGLTRNSALAHLGLLRTYPSRVEVAVGPNRGLRPSRRFHPVRSSLLTPEDLAVHGGLPVVAGPALTRDLAATRDRAALRAVIIDLAQAGWVEVDGLPTWLGAQPRFAGRSVLRQVVTDLAGAGRTDSTFEFEVRARLRAEGIPLDRGQVPLPGGRRHVDLGILAIRFGIELAGFAFHRSRSALVGDAERANAIAALNDDWRVLVGTWEVLGAGFPRFVVPVREVISAQTRRHLGRPWPRPEDLCS